MVTTWTSSLKFPLESSSRVSVRGNRPPWPRRNGGTLEEAVTDYFIRPTSSAPAWPFTGVVAVALPRSSREHGHHWTTTGVSGYGPWLVSTWRKPDPLLSSWMSSSPAYTLQDFPVPADLASEHTAGPSLTQTPGNSNGGSVPANHAPTAASKYSNTDRPCCVQVAITVQIRSHQRLGLIPKSGDAAGDLS